MCFLAETFDRGEDLVGGLGATVGFGALVVSVDEGPDIGLELVG
jgi:hypothetical protein